MKPGTKQGPNLEVIRSRVRVVVTYGAADFLFAGGFGLIIVALTTEVLKPGIQSSKGLVHYNFPHCHRRCSLLVRFPFG